MGQRNGLAIQLPGQQRVFHGRHWHAAFDTGLGVDAGRQDLAAGAGHELGHAVDAAQAARQFLHRHTGPHHAAGGPGLPGRAAGLAGEIAAAVAAALQHHRHGFGRHLFQLGQRQRGWAPHAFDLHLPRVGLGHHAGVRRVEVVAHVKLVDRRDNQAHRGAARLDGAGTVHDHRPRVLERGQRGQRARRSGRLSQRHCWPEQGQQAGGGRTGQQAAAQRIQVKGQLGLSVLRIRLGVEHGRGLSIRVGTGIKTLTIVHRSAHAAGHFFAVVTQPRGWCCACSVFSRSRAMWV